MEIKLHPNEWKSWEKLLFRFFFSFLLLISLFAYNPLFNLLDFRYNKLRIINSHLVNIICWLDDHIFHIGYIPRVHSVDFSDTHFGVVVTLTILIISFLACILWSLIDKEKYHYNRLYYWFSNYLSYYIFLAMLPYAITKIIPIQAHYPTAPELLTRWGDLLNWEVLFRFMGTSPAFCMLCGWLELIASLLILFSRTRTLGGLLMVFIMTQVLGLNIFYNNNIKILSGTLLLASLFIIAKALPILYAFFLTRVPVSLVPYRYKFTTPWKKYIIIIICLLPTWRIYSLTQRSWVIHQGYLRNEKNQSLYNVVLFQQARQTIPSLQMDTLSWKYVCFLDYAPGNQRVVKFDMQENQSIYQCTWDTVHKEILLINDDTARLAYAFLPNGNLQLNGYWQGDSTKIQLSKIAIDSLILLKDKYQFMIGDAQD